MDREAVKEALGNPLLRGLIQASILVAFEGGQTVRCLADAFGIPKSTVHRFIVQRRNERDKPPRINARTVMAPCGADGCQCRVTAAPGLEICLDCGQVSPLLALAIRRDHRPDPPRISNRVVNRRERRKSLAVNH